MNAPFRLRALDHVVLRVSDMNRMIRFYCEVLGCREERRLDAIGLVQLRAGSSLVDLVPRAPDESDGDRSVASVNMDHFALTIEPFDSGALEMHFAAHGVTIGPVASRYGSEGHGPSIYLYDPEGNQIELKGPPTTGLEGS